jgi:hypothetical protein
MKGMNSARRKNTNSFPHIGCAAFVPLLLCLLALASPARAELLLLSIDQPERTALPGSTVAFTGTITNRTGVDLDAAADLFLNFNGFDATALSFNQVLGVPDFSLPNGSTSPDVELFDALVDPLATVAGSPYLADVTVSDSLGDVSDPVTIRIDVVPAPLIGHGLLVLLAVGGILFGVKFLERIKNRPEPGSLALLVTAMVMMISFVKGGIGTRWLRRALVPISAIVATLIVGTAHAAVTGVSLYAANAATSVWNTNTTKVGVQLQISNSGSSTAHDVLVTSITVQGGSLSPGGGIPPITLGTIDAGEGAPLDIVINAPTTNGTTRYLLTVNGTYSFAGNVYSFSVNRALFPNAAGPGTILPKSGTSVIFNPNTASFPTPPALPSFGPNAETPIFVPIGPPSLLFPPTPTPTPADATVPAGAPVQIPVNNLRGVGAGTPPDPNAATSNGGVALSTYNTGISYSTDNGATFTDVNLFNPIAGRSSFFPQSDGGLCCDQVVVFVPDPNRPLFVWLQQYWPQTMCATNCGPPPAMNATFKITQPNRLRVAWATPAAIKADFNNAWTYADLTATSVAGVSDGLGTKNNEWMDYPDLAWSDSFLYVGVDHGSTTPGQVFIGKRIVARLSLADMRNSAATVVHYDFAELSGSNGLNKDHFVQRAPNRMVVGSLDNSSTMRVFTWDDGSGSINNSTVGISQINQGANYTSKAPDNTDWVAVSFPGNITGAVYRAVIPGLGVPSRDEYVFAFDAGVNAPGRPSSYVRLETLTPSGSGFSAFAEYDIWNTAFAFAMAALARDNELVMPDIGINVAVGGGTIGYPQMSVGFKDDFVVFQVTNSNASQGSRFGDYLSTRYIDGSDAQFDAEVYDVILNPVPPGGTPTCAAVGCVAKPRYIQYGRPPFNPPG